jgi:hypothetical protein
MKLYKKIDLFYNGDYLCSTNQAKTCREARTKYLDTVRHDNSKLGLLDQRIKKHPELLKARIDHKHRSSK